MTRTYVLTAPSKTFLLGEYVALKAGPALVLTTKPNFELVANYNSDNNMNHDAMIHPNSPAGKLIASDPTFYHHYKMLFNDPHHGAGGFGASSAQYLLLKELRDVISHNEISDKELVAAYQSVCAGENGNIPSGYDVLAQKHGKICFILQKENYIQTYSWPFKQLSYALIRTGKKLPTHDHLSNLGNFSIAQFAPIVYQGLRSIENNDANTFIDCINEYASTMQNQGLIASHSQEQIDRLTLNPLVLAAKGCGGLGADVILIIYNSANEAKILAWLNEFKLKIAVYGNEVGQGLEINGSLSSGSNKNGHIQNSIHR